MPDPHPLEPERRSGCLGWASGLAVFLGVAVAIALFYFWQQTGSNWLRAYREAQALAARFDRAFNFTPEIRIGSRTVIAATVPKFEVVTAEKQAVIRKTWSHTWLHSTKTFDIEATFTARAGYDLSSAFTIHIDPANAYTGVSLPNPKILSIGMSDVHVLTDEDGLWNRLTPEDRQEAFRALEAQATITFLQTDLIATAGQEMQKRLQELAVASGARKVQVNSPEPVLKIQAPAPVEKP